MAYLLCGPGKHSQGSRSRHKQQASSKATREATSTCRNWSVLNRPSQHPQQPAAPQEFQLSIKKAIAGFQEQKTCRVLYHITVRSTESLLPFAAGHAGAPLALMLTTHVPADRVHHSAPKVTPRLSGLVGAEGAGRVRLGTGHAGLGDEGLDLRLADGGGAVSKGALGLLRQLLPKHLRAAVRDPAGALHGPMCRSGPTCHQSSRI